MACSVENHFKPWEIRHPKGLTEELLTLVLGTLIALDIMHDQMKYENAVDVLGCVTALRAQRNFMVQTEEQYIFVYDALLEMAEGGYTEVPARGLYAQYNSLLQPDGMGYCGFDIEFKV